MKAKLTINYLTTLALGATLPFVFAAIFWGDLLLTEADITAFWLNFFGV